MDPAEPAILKGLTQFGSDVRQIDGTIRLRTGSEAILPSVAKWLVEHDVRLYEMRSRRPSLEQVFLEVMGEDQRPA